MKSLFSFFAYDEKGNQESMTVLSYQFRNIPIWLLEDRVVYSSMPLINPLTLYPQILFGLFGLKLILPPATNTSAPFKDLPCFTRLLAYFITSLLACLLYSEKLFSLLKMQ